ncbi:MAG: type II secretion system F family protein [Armatimonadetes bacterium]|nr:type II secretion system F family protein [Armatimonadota bacterium]
MPELFTAVAMALVAGIIAFGVMTLLQSRSSGALDRVSKLRTGGTTAGGATAHVRPPSTGFGSRGDQAPLLGALLKRANLWEELQMELLRAGLLLKPSELIAGVVLAGLVGAGIGIVVFRHVAGGIFLGAGAAILPWVLIKVRQAKRSRDLANQLPDAIDMLSAALRSGFSFLRGVQTVASQMQPPISEEFRRLAAEVQMGMSTDEALDNLVDRTQCYDLELVVAAVQIQLEVGGNLSEVLDNIAETIRERIRLQQEIGAATAEVRLSSTVLFAMPVFIALAINFLNPGYLKPLFTTPLGMTLALAAGVLMALGALIIRKMMDIDI